MIIEWITRILVNIVMAFFSILPNVPATPADIISGGDWVIQQIVGTIAFIRTIYGNALLVAIVVVMAALVTFPWIYHSVMWILKKIPMLNIK